MKIFFEINERIKRNYFLTFDSHTSSLLRKKQAIQMPHPKENKQIAWRLLMFEILQLIQIMLDGQKWKQWTSTLPEHLQVPIEMYYNLISVYVLWIMYLFEKLKWIWDCASNNNDLLRHEFEQCWSKLSLWSY